jgi:hypothetical protein
MTPRIIFVCAALLLSSAAFAKPRSVDPDNQSGKREMHMANCPSAVLGAVTTVVELEDGVELTVTAREEWAQQEIRRRAQSQGASAWEPERGAIEHTGLGTGSGRYGFCPGVLEGTTVDAELRPDGATLTVRADRPAQAEKLKEVTRERMKWLKSRRTPRS